jgi:diadenosine tetraphosphate (Ap4A) HIT family hydrolase
MEGVAVPEVDCQFCKKLAVLDSLQPDELVCRLPHSVVLLGPWQYFQGYCIVVARTHAAELSQLREGDRTAYFGDMCRVAKAIELEFQPRKLNYELLGNQVPHLHWHLFPRYASDPDGLKPVWLALDRAERDEKERERLQGNTSSRSIIAERLRQRIVPDR